MGRRPRRNHTPAFKAKLALPRRGKAVQTTGATSVSPPSDRGSWYVVILMRALRMCTQSLTRPPKSMDLRKLKLTNCAAISGLPERGLVLCERGATQPGPARSSRLHRSFRRRKRAAQAARRAWGWCASTASAPGSTGRALWRLRSRSWDERSTCHQNRAVRIAYNSGVALKACSAPPVISPAVSGQLARIVLDRLDMVAAGAPERHQFRVRANRGNAANDLHRGAAARAPQFGLALALHEL
jgi:hypothetical protein